LDDLSKYSPEDLRQYVTTGKPGQLPQELIKYLDVLELCRSMFDKYYDREVIIKTLMTPTYNLTRYTASRMVSDMLNFFYANNTVKQEAWQEIYAQRFDKLAELALFGKDDIDLARVCWAEAAKARGIDKPKPREIPPEFYQKKVIIYSSDPELFGIERADKTKLAALIDEIPDISTKERTRLKRHSGVFTLNIPEDLEETKYTEEPKEPETKKTKQTQNPKDAPAEDQ